MKITKNLKYANFEWDDESKTFTITEEDGNRVILNKVYSFAFMRFVIRMAQRNWLRQTNKQKKVLDKTGEDVLLLDNNEDNLSNKDQMLFFEEIENEEVMGIQSQIQKK